MMWALAITLVFIFLLFCAWWMPITLEVYFARHGGNDDGFVSLTYLFGLVRKTHTLKALDTTVTKEGPTLTVHHHSGATSKAQSGSASREAHFSTKIFWQFLRHWPFWYRVANQIKPILLQIARRLDVRQLRAEIVVGTGDAVLTGVACGAVWSILGPALGWWTHVSQFETNPSVKVQPSFQSRRFSIELHSIIQVRAGYAISGTLRILRVWKRRASYGSPDSGFDADRHGEHS